MIFEEVVPNVDMRGHGILYRIVRNGDSTLGVTVYRYACVSETIIHQLRLHP